MSMYRIRNRKTNQIFSESLGWIDEHGKMYGHCFDYDLAYQIANVFSFEGIPVVVELDKVASRFVFSAKHLSFKKVMPLTIIIFFSLFVVVYIINKIDVEVLVKLFNR